MFIHTLLVVLAVMFLGCALLMFGLMKSAAIKTPKPEPRPQVQAGQNSAYTPLPVDFTDYDDPVGIYLVSFD